VELTEEENEEYHSITRKIVRLMASLEDQNLEDERLQNLLVARARVINRARNKLNLLRELVAPRTDSCYNLFYCGDSKVDGERQVELVTRLLGRDLGMKVHPFTSQESAEERRQLLELFESGRIQGLVAIRCLDEGVDVPATQTAYIMASSTNPREFIQRRGRILRRHPGKRYATIYDFIVVPRSLDEIRSLEPDVFNLERKLVRRELMRVVEFADCAENGPQAHRELLPLKKVFNLLDL